MLKFIFTLFLIFFLLPPLFKWLLRLFISKQVGKAQEQFYKQQQNPFGGNKTRKEGEIKVEVPQDTRKNKDFGGGEYVDYEEVK